MLRPLRRFSGPLGVMVLLVVAPAACTDDSSDPSTDNSGDAAESLGDHDVSIDDPGPATSTSNPGPNPTSSDPGPNTTTADPGPNDTSGGPATVSGSLVLDDPAGCITLEAEEATFDLRLSGYSLGESGGSPALLDDIGQPIARPGDTVFVSGFERDEQGDCGTRFDVDSLNSVLPAG